VVSILANGLQRLVQERIPYNKPMQQVVLRQRHQVLLLMHNLHQQLHPAGTVTQPTCATATGSFRLQVMHPIPILSRRVVKAYLVQD
jgi:hypothetical protein